MAARRLHVAVQIRSRSREALEREWYHRRERLVNLLRSTRRAGKVEHLSSALALVALTHLSYMHSEHPFMLELASSSLTKLPCSPPRTIQAFGRLARKGGCTSSAAGGSVGSTSARLGSSTGCVLWAWAAAASLLRHLSLTFLHRRASAAGSGSRPNLQRLACGLYSTDQHGWKLCCCLLGALGKDQSSLHDAAAIQ